MKTKFILLLMPLAVSAAPMTDRVTTDQLEDRRQQASPIAQLDQRETVETTVSRPAEQSIIKQSVIISDGVNWTLVPKGAVIHLPESHKAKVGVRPIGNLMSWSDFLTRNVAWIAAEEVSLRQAEGIEKFDERRTSFWPKQDRVLVAVHRGGPISVTVPAEGTETANTR